MKNEVKIYKIGNILTANQVIIKKHRLSKKTIMLAIDLEDCNPYINILTEKCKEEYKFMKTNKSIIGTPSRLNKLESIKGFLNSEPIVGNVLDLGYWRTSTIERVIDDFIIITENSVYVIHDISLLRDKRLNDLGL